MTQNPNVTILIVFFRKGCWFPSHGVIFVLQSMLIEYFLNKHYWYALLIFVNFLGFFFIYNSPISTLCINIVSMLALVSMLNFEIKNDHSFQCFVILLLQLQINISDILIYKNAHIAMWHIAMHVILVYLLITWCPRPYDIPLGRRYNVLYLLA